MTTTVRIAAAQTPEFREDVASALDYLVETAERAAGEGVALLCFPEGFLQGYLTDETAARRDALDLGSQAFAAVLARLPQNAPMIVLGLIEEDQGRLFNTAAVIHRGSLVGRYRKIHLLKSERCFDPGLTAEVFEVDGLRFGIVICYDSNFPKTVKRVADLGASLIVSPANNMLPRQAAQDWKHVHNAVRGDRCRETGLWLISADVTGERDGWVAWGPTAVLTPAGEIAAQLPLDKPGLLVFDLPIG